MAAIKQPRGKNTTASKRFNYLYSEDEIMEWKPRIMELAAKSRQMHIVFNNCYDDKAVRNARYTRTLFD
jgi:uncharacterized protein YecE (DUF72 family)